MSLMDHINYWKNACLLTIDQLTEWCGKHIVGRHEPVSNWSLDMYRDKRKEYRWRLVAANGKIVCVSSEGYKTKQGADHSFDIVRDNIKKAIRT